jgi:hypothetical protein
MIKILYNKYIISFAFRQYLKDCENVKPMCHEKEITDSYHSDILQTSGEKFNKI